MREGVRGGGRGVDAWEAYKHVDTSATGVCHLHTPMRRLTKI